MQLVYFVLLLLGLVVFLIAAFSSASPKINWVALGLSCWIAVPLLQVAQRL